MKKIVIENPKKYEICFAASFDMLAESIKKVSPKSRKAFIISDSNVAPLYLEEVRKNVSGFFSGTDFYIIDAGEKSKTLAAAEAVIKAMIEAGYNRDDIIIALGGGVVGDLAGFCAAIYMRGIDFIQIPTTLLSQIDSSIGGKTAVDMDAYKNMIGAFHNPVLVYENSSCLKTLPQEQYLSGMGEVIKSALLGNKDLLLFLYANFSGTDFKDIEDAALIHVLYSTCLIKKQVVEEDPFDTGKRAVLNLGHTIGHAIEKCSDFRLSHGECVALGTIGALYISLKRNYITRKEYDNVYSFMQSIGLFTVIPENTVSGKDDILKALSRDKKNSSSGLKFILTEGIGNAVIKTDVTGSEIDEALAVIGIK